MAEEKTSPLDIPDAVVSGSRTHYRRLDGGRWFALKVWLAKVLRRPMPSQRFLVRIIYREWQEKCEVVHLNAGMIGPFVQKLMAAPLVRQVFVAELCFKGRKSFGADYDPDKLFEFIKSAAKNAA